MGKAHSHAFKTLPYMIYPPPAIPHLVAIAGRNESACSAAARRYGYEKVYTDWQALLDDPAVELFDNAGPNDVHAAPVLYAAQQGKHILCEKPLARSAAEAKTMRDAVQRSGVKAMVAHNYRFVPALRLAYDLIQSGQLGRIYHFRAVYLQEWIMDPQFERVWRLDASAAGSGALGDLGSHIIDLARWLVGEPAWVMAGTQTFIPERPLPGGGGLAPVEVDDAFAAVVQFEQGALGTLEATRFGKGRKNYEVLELNAERGSLRFNLERLNELEVFWADAPTLTQGFTPVLVSEAAHPFWKYWWPQGHIIGWEHTFTHEIAHLLEAIVNDTPIGPLGATFEDGYRTAVVSDAILESARSGRRVEIQYEE
jgi:predicted dehydrogenase